jgi:hypothetical protein
MKRTVLLLTLITLGGSVATQARDLLVRFDSAVGVIPVSAGTGANGDGTFANVRPNVVRGVSPGAGPWRISDLHAEVDVDGRIRVRGHGLLLASGNSIGQNGGQSVFATLICEPSLPFVEHSSSHAGVPLDQNGDFRIDDVLDSVPAACASPVLLIRNVTAGVWFAAGLPQLGDD